MKKYLLALDEGTTSARAILFDREGKIVSLAQREFPLVFPKPGWVEQDPMQIYASQVSVMSECVAASGVSASEVAAIGITNQRETTVVWEKETGTPVYNAVVWQCRRTASFCDELNACGKSDMIREKTGLRPDAYFSGTKLKWILDHVEGARERAEKGELLFGTVESWLVWKLTEGKVHVTDATNACRTMLYNIRTGLWDDDLLALLDIPKIMLPRVVSSSEIYGETDVMGVRIPIAGLAGDQQAALFGHGCFAAGEAKNTYGTGCFLLAHTGAEIRMSQNGLLTTVAATEAGKAPEYALEGSVFTGGAVIQWLRDELRLITDAKDSEYFAGKVKDNGGVYFVPAFAGLGAPYWDQNARGSIVGLTRGSGRNHIIRAALESIAYQTADVIAAMEADLGKKITSLQVDGGASANRFLMQFQSDISRLSVEIPEMAEATALGAAFLAGLAVGFYRDREELKSILKTKAKFTPQTQEEVSRQQLDGWHRAVASCRAY